MKKYSIFCYVVLLLNAQEDSAFVDTAKIIPEDVFINQGLEFGYKGYQWGQSINSIPDLDRFTDGKVDESRFVTTMEGILGLDKVTATFYFSDSGFWKVEFDYEIDQKNIESQMELYLRLEKDISHVYGNPVFTEHTNHGPTSAYSDALNVKFSRAFYSSSWNVVPVKLLLILNGLVQQPNSGYKVVDGNLSFIKLIYYNPDYMYTITEDTKEVIPSIFDIY